MRAAIYTPYLDTLGGGERYMLSIASILLEEGYDVDIENKNDKLIAQAEKRFSLKLTKLNSTESIGRGDGYDVCVWLSNGSIPLLRSRHNIIHFQRPFQDVDGSSLINRMKLIRIKDIIVNSEFTKSFIDKEFPVKSKILYPPVDIDKFKAKRKENLILYVGRFSQLEQSKRQDILVESFLKLHKDNPTWKLVLAGGSEVGRTNYVDKLKSIAKGKNIQILESPEFNTLKDLYGKAKIFWSASGFEVDESKHPHKVEHFGITTVEAMAAKAVPIIFNAGGHKEIIENNHNGFLWLEEEELINITDKLIKNSKQLRSISTQAHTDSIKFSYEKFKETFTSLL